MINECVQILAYVDDITIVARDNPSLNRAFCEICKDAKKKAGINEKKTKDMMCNEKRLELFGKIKI